MFCVFCFIVLFSVLFVCNCVLYYYHWLQLTIISSVYVSVCAVIRQNVLEYYGDLKDKVCTHF